MIDSEGNNLYEKSIMGVRYAESCKEWCAFADKNCGSLSETDQKKLGSIFERAGYLELDFWNMAYRRKKA